MDRESKYSSKRSSRKPSFDKREEMINTDINQNMIINEEDEKNLNLDKDDEDLDEEENKPKTERNEKKGYYEGYFDRDENDDNGNKTEIYIPKHNKLKTFTEKMNKLYNTTKNIAQTTYNYGKSVYHFANTINNIYNNNLIRFAFNYLNNLH